MTCDFGSGPWSSEVPLHYPGRPQAAGCCRPARRDATSCDMRRLGESTQGRHQPDGSGRTKGLSWAMSASALLRRSCRSQGRHGASEGFPATCATAQVPLRLTVCNAFRFRLRPALLWEGASPSGNSDLAINTSRQTRAQHLSSLSISSKQGPIVDVGLKAHDCQARLFRARMCPQVVHRNCACAG